MNTQNAVYLDYNATAPARPAVIAAVTEILRAPGNASSIHSFGRSARAHLETAREQVGALACAAARQVIFNSGATEGNNTVLRAYAGERLLIDAGAHSSIAQLGTALGTQSLPLTPEGIIDLAALEEICTGTTPPALVSIMLVNNETGVINPVEHAAPLIRRAGALFHVDAVQAAGKIPIDIGKIGADFMTLSAHKIGGPQGVGALILSDGQTACIAPPVLLTGGGQERGWRAGTENVAGIAGFGIAAREAQIEQASLSEKLTSFRNDIESALLASSPRVRIHGAAAPRVAGTVCFSVEGAQAQTLLIQLDLAGIAVSAGAACSSGKVKASPVLAAMGVPETQARGALRLSMGYGTTRADIDAFITLWSKLTARF